MNDSANQTLDLANFALKGVSITPNFSQFLGDKRVGARVHREVNRGKKNFDVISVEILSRASGGLDQNTLVVREAGSEKIVGIVKPFFPAKGLTKFTCYEAPSGVALIIEID